MSEPNYITHPKWTRMSAKDRPLCSGGCNARHRREADYPAKSEPWRCLKFRCAGCKTWRPWCNGASDEHPSLCDGCWSLAHKRAS